jgi:hypothetical protein
MAPRKTQNIFCRSRTRPFEKSPRKSGLGKNKRGEVGRGNARFSKQVILQLQNIVDELMLYKNPPPASSLQSNPSIHPQTHHFNSPNLSTPNIRTRTSVSRWCIIGIGINRDSWVTLWRITRNISQVRSTRTLRPATSNL